MDHERFDELTAALADDTSRRTLFKGFVGGGLAAALTAIGIGSLSPDGVEAKKKKGCRARCNQKRSRTARNRCRRRCNKKPPPPPPTTVNVQTISTNVTGALVGQPCTVSSDCLALLVCSAGACAACLTPCPTGATTTCCAVGLCDVNGGVDVCVIAG